MIKETGVKIGFRGALGTHRKAYLVYVKYLLLLIWLCVCRLLVSDVHKEGCVELSGEGILSQTARLWSWC